MIVAIPQWRGRVSPVFDVAGNVLVAEIENGAERARREVVFDAGGPQQRVAQLKETGAGVLVCGAISWQLELAVLAANIEVIPHTCGDVERVLEAFIDGRLDQGAFLMPGCRGRRRVRSQHRRGSR